jgi:hypothetical protein
MGRPAAAEFQAATRAAAFDKETEVLLRAIYAVGF